MLISRSYGAVPELEEAASPDGSPRIGACKTPAPAPAPKQAARETVRRAQPQQPAQAPLQQQTTFVPLIPVRATHAAGVQPRREHHTAYSPKERADQVLCFLQSMAAAA